MLHCLGNRGLISITTLHTTLSLIAHFKGLKPYFRPQTFAIFQKKKRKLDKAAKNVLKNESKKTPLLFAKANVLQFLISILLWIALPFYVDCISPQFGSRQNSPMHPTNKTANAAAFIKPGKGQEREQFRNLGIRRSMAPCISLAPTLFASWRK